MDFHANSKWKYVRYKVWLIIQGFFQSPEIIFDETYSSPVDASTFRYLISLIAYEEFNLHIMGVVRMHLYDLFNSDFCMKLYKEFNSPETHNFGS